LPLTLLRTEPDVGSALLNEETGELLAFQETQEGGSIRLRGPLLSATLVLPAEKKPGSIRLEGGPSLPLQSRPPGPLQAKIGSNGPPGEDEVFVAPEGSIKVPPEERKQHLFHPKPGRTPRPELLFQGRWLPSSGRGSAPARVVLGRQLLRPERREPERALGCLIHGVVPVMEGPLGEATREAWQSWVRDRCKEAGPDAVIELSYSTVRLAGVNLPSCEPRAVNDPPLTSCAEPPSGVHLPVHMRARVTSNAGSFVVEEALLLDTKAGTLERLTSLASAGMTPVLKEWATHGMQAFPSWFPREALLWPPPGPLPGAPFTSLTVGPSTIDVVIPTAPLGLFLRSRHAAIGPRSTFAAAFKPSAATRRLTAAVLVDF
jgi:hypothetical protein